MKAYLRMMSIVLVLVLSQPDQPNPLQTCSRTPRLCIACDLKPEQPFKLHDDITLRSVVKAVLQETLRCYISVPAKLPRMMDSNLAAAKDLSLTTPKAR